jgi:hypothetical protein
MMIIDGEEVDSSSKQRMEVLYPATEKVVGSVPKGNAEEVDRVVKAARKAYRPWARMMPAERSTLLLKLADRLDSDLKRLAALETSQTGKPRKLSMFPAVAAPMAAKIPVPMTALMPSMVRSSEVRVRFRVWPVLASDSRVIRSTLFVRNRAEKFIPGTPRASLVDGERIAAAICARVPGESTISGVIGRAAIRPAARQRGGDSIGRRRQRGRCDGSDRKAYLKMRPYQKSVE